MLEIPHTTEHARTVRAALIDVSIEPGLRERFGSEPVSAAQKNAWQWLAHRVWEPYTADEYQRLTVPETLIVVPDDTSIPLTVMNTERDEIDPPEPYDDLEGEIVLMAVRMMAHSIRKVRSDNRRLAFDYLAEYAPSIRERKISRIAAHALTGVNQLLVQYKYARTTRGRNSSNRLGSIATKANSQDRYS